MAQVNPIVNALPSYYGVRRSSPLLSKAEQEARSRRIATAIRERRVAIAADDDLSGCLEDERDICARADHDGRL